MVTQEEAKKQQESQLSANKAAFEKQQADIEATKDRYSKSEVEYQLKKHGITKDTVSGDRFGSLSKSAQDVLTKEGYVVTQASSPPPSQGKSETQQQLELHNLTAGNIDQATFEGLSPAAKDILIKQGYVPKERATSDVGSFYDTYDASKGLNAKDEAVAQLKLHGISFETIMSSENPQGLFENLSPYAQQEILKQQENVFSVGKTSDKISVSQEESTAQSNVFTGTPEQYAIYSGRVGEYNALVEEYNKSFTGEIDEGGIFAEKYTKSTTKKLPSSLTKTSQPAPSDEIFLGSEEQFQSYLGGIKSQLSSVKEQNKQALFSQEQYNKSFLNIGGAKIPASLVSPEVAATAYAIDKKSGLLQRRQSAAQLSKLLSTEEYKGSEIDIMVNGKVIKTTSGQNAYLDIIKASYQQKGEVTFQAYKTKSDRQFANKLLGEAEKYNSNAIYVTSPYQKVGEKLGEPKIIEAIPKNESAILESVAKYQRENKIVTFNLIPSKTVIHEPGGEIKEPIGQFIYGAFKTGEETIKSSFQDPVFILPPSMVGGKVLLPKERQAPGSALVASQGGKYPEVGEKYFAGTYETYSSKQIGNLIGGKPLTAPKTAEEAGSIFFDVGSMILPLKSAVPLRYTKVALPYQEGIQGYKGITLGYEGARAKYLIGAVGKKIIAGQPKAEKLNLDKLAETTTRYGFKTGSGSPVVNRVITKEVVPFLEKSGRLSKKGALDVLETGEEGVPLAKAAPTIQQREGFGERPIKDLSNEQSDVLLGLLKEKKYTLTGSASEIPFTKEGLVATARDIDIKGASLEEATQFNIEAAKRLNKVALEGELFEAQGTKLLFTSKRAGLIQEKKVEFPQKDVMEGSPGMSEEFVFKQKVPTGTTTIKGVKMVTFNFQGLSKISSATEWHIGGLGEVKIGAAVGRELKDPAHVYSFLKTKASNYLTVGEKAKGTRLNEIAESYKLRHPEFDFSKEFTAGAGSETLSFGKQQTSSLLSSGLKQGKSASLLLSGLSGSKNISAGYSAKYPSVISNKSLSSGLSGKSGLSGLSGKSGLSGLSGKSGLSGLSAKSGINTKSILSGTGSKILSGRLSGKSSLSGLSGKSGLSGLSAKGNPSRASPMSSLSGPSMLGLSMLSPKSLVPQKPPPTQIIPTFGGNLPIKRGYKAREGPTRIFKWSVRNPFASSLNIIEK